MHLKRIHNSEGIFQYAKGFTLIEILVSVALIATAGTIVLSIFVISLRGTQKASVVASVRQNGDFAINQMAKNIRFSQSAAVYVNGVYTTSCATVSPTPALNSPYMITTDTDGNQTVYWCGYPSTTNIGVWTVKLNTQYLLDTSKAVLVPGSCSFTCYQGVASDPPEISIQFSLTQANTSGASAVTIPFHTTVTLRNFPR